MQAQNFFTPIHFCLLIIHYFNSLQELGATFVVDETLKTSVYCCRTGLRLWKSNLDGNVELTIKFKVFYILRLNLGLSKFVSPVGFHS